MQWLPLPSEHSTRLGELAELFFACQDAFRDVVLQTQWHPSPDSLAERDRRHLTEHDPPFPPDVPLLIPKVLYSYMFGAGEHLAGLGALYGTRQVLLTPGVLVRVTLEYCAHVAWVIQGRELQGRLARAYLEHVTSAEEAQKNSKKLLGKASEQYQRELQRYRALKKQARQIFPEPWQTKDGDPKYAGETMLGLEATVVALYDSERAGSGIYGLLSNFTHPTLYTITRLSSVVQDGDELKPTLHLTVEDHDRRAQLAVTAFYTAFDATIQYYGWPHDGADALAERINVTLPGAVAAPISPTDPPAPSSSD
jgi:hypothetical protein